MDKKIKTKNNLIILISKKTNHLYYYDINSNDDYHCKEGLIKKEDILNINLNIIKSNLNREFIKFNASNYDLSNKIKRGPQIITNKDLGYIISRTRINKNSKIVEAGGGSGGATIFFSNIVKEVKTYEINEKHSSIIEFNLNKQNITNVKLINKDLRECIGQEKNIDLLFLDMPEPSIILNEDLSGIKNGSYIVCYLPSIIQIIELYKTITNNPNLYLEEVSEIILRKWKINNNVSRPEFNKETDHTAFLIFIRKI